MDQQSLSDTSAQIAHGKEAVGYIFDAALGASALAAWLFQIEQILGGIIALAIAVLALGTAVYRFLYWRSRSKTQGMRESRETREEEWRENE